MTAERILLTGFEPFGGEAVNPSWRVAQALHGSRIGGGATVFAACLPTVFGAAAGRLRQALDESGATLVLALGQAAGRSEMSLERVAINLDDARIADNAGSQPIDSPVVPGAPAAYFTTLPIKAMVLAMREAGCPAGVSYSAGTFVCNHVFFALMHELARRPGVRGGFMHVPLLPQQAARQGGAAPPSLALAEMVAGVRVALATALDTAHDLRHSEGVTA